MPAAPPDSDVPVYAGVKAIQAAGELEERLYQRTDRPPPDTFAAFLKEQTVPTTSDDEAPWHRPLGAG
jgi:hypothetical protein